MSHFDIVPTHETLTIVLVAILPVLPHRRRDVACEALRAKCLLRIVLRIPERRVELVIVALESQHLLDLLLRVTVLQALSVLVKPVVNVCRSSAECQNSRHCRNWFHNRDFSAIRLQLPSESAARPLDRGLDLARCQACWYHQADWLAHVPGLTDFPAGGGTPGHATDPGNPEARQRAHNHGTVRTEHHGQRSRTQAGLVARGMAGTTRLELEALWRRERVAAGGEREPPAEILSAPRKGSF